MATLAGVVQRLLEEVTSGLGPMEEMEPRARHQGGGILSRVFRDPELGRSWLVWKTERRPVSGEQIRQYSRI